MIKYIKLYFEFIKQNIKTLLEYRTDFIIGTLSSFIAQLSGILFVWVVFKNIRALNGWSFYEITLLYGIFAFVKSITAIVFDNLWSLGSSYIRKGRLDIVLLKPLSPLFQIISDRIEFDSIGQTIIALIIITKSINELQLKLTPESIAMSVIFLISGIIILGAIRVIFSLTSFWIIDSYEIVWSVLSIGDFALYPINIFNKYIQVIVTWLLPFAFVSFYPLNYFIDKGYYNLSLLSPLIALISWLISMFLWKVGLRYYNSTGS